MARKKLKQKKKNKPKKPSFLNCFICLTNSDESDDSASLPDRPKASKAPKQAIKQLQSTSKMLTAQHEVSVTYRTSSFFVLNPETEPQNKAPNNNMLLSQAYLEKLQSDSKEPEKSPLSDKKSSISVEDREQKDQLVKTILSKYLQIKRQEMLNREQDHVHQFSKPPPPPKHPQKFNCLRMDCSSDSSETVLLDTDREERPKADFPTKSRSAPTTSTAHDSLADICFKMSRYKQQDNKSDSYVTCCSEDNVTPHKKKLELIFNHSSDEFYSVEDSPFAVDYAISCEGTPVTTDLNHWRILLAVAKC
ncbi:hypothetical protein TcasGA2_TC014665 [Tribolium castaneum]|uniref:Uncharacterized protein n=1 Tax=Tribolium castaneum TaxID=7070 RepID=A0A139WHN7_TRICA|nr:PREDICTED: uncharacterized protein LOC103313259 isoform X2 [Tribolium castaneum]KYB27371.1 hypothetical protein TcasGA2_TC014665 [Tribolium castaneum]|eukprot:XP_008194317.2 PREDICTED: uncharacterized protein LOC103313259 isoform X2 [Tribolium castaneum]